MAYDSLYCQLKTHLVAYCWWSTSLYVIYCRLRCGQRGSTCARHITLDWIIFNAFFYAHSTLLFVCVGYVSIIPIIVTRC